MLAQLAQVDDPDLRLHGVWALKNLTFKVCWSWLFIISERRERRAEGGFFFWARVRMYACSLPVLLLRPFVWRLQSLKVLMLCIRHGHARTHTRTHTSYSMQADREVKEMIVESLGWSGILQYVREE